MAEYSVGDLVEVLDEGLAMLRRLCPDMPPNHHGRVWKSGATRFGLSFPSTGATRIIVRSPRTRRKWCGDDPHNAQFGRVRDLAERL